jgi:hypothetical protein
MTETAHSPDDEATVGAPLPGPDPRLRSLVADQTAQTAQPDQSDQPDQPEPSDAKKGQPMTRESVMESLEPDQKPPEPQPSDLWGVLKAILSTPWGRRAALIIVGIVLFFVGFVGGHWGKSDLHGQLADREREIVAYKKEKARLESELEGATRERDQLNLRLRESEEKREFYKQRDKIRKFVSDCRKAWEARNVKEALESLHKANIHFQNEARAARGVSAYLYRTIARRIQEALTAMETDCADTKPAPRKSLLDPPVPAGPSCQERVNALLQQVLDALPPARED